MIFEAVADFRDALPEGGVLIGLDVGSKTIGTAFCDAGWTFASPADLIKRSKFSKDKARLPPPSPPARQRASSSACR